MVCQSQTQGNVCQCQQPGLLVENESKVELNSTSLYVFKRSRVQTFRQHIVAGATKPRISKMLNVQESQKTWRL